MYSSWKNSLNGWCEMLCLQLYVTNKQYTIFEIGYGSLVICVILKTLVAIRYFFLVDNLLLSRSFNFAISVKWKFQWVLISRWSGKKLNCWKNELYYIAVYGNFIHDFYVSEPRHVRLVWVSLPQFCTPSVSSSGTRKTKCVHTSCE